MYTRRNRISKIASSRAQALELSFERAFSAVEPTGKKLLIAVDVSGSMSQPCHGSDALTAMEAAAAIALIMTRIEVNTKVGTPPTPSPLLQPGR